MHRRFAIAITLVMLTLLVTALAAPSHAVSAPQQSQTSSESARLSAFTSSSVAALIDGIIAEQACGSRLITHGPSLGGFLRNGSDPTQRIWVRASCAGVLQVRFSPLLRPGEVEISECVLPSV